MRFLFLSLLLSLLLYTENVNGTLEHLEQRLSGVWSLKNCECVQSQSASVQCKDLFADSYTISTDLAGKTFTALSNAPANPGQSKSSFTFIIDEAGTTHLSSVPYACAGVLTDEVICINTTTDVTACTAKFDCTSGDCIGSVFQQRFRSIVYPVIGIVASILWFGFPFAPNGAPTIGMALAIVEGVIALTMLASPFVYVPLLVLAASAFSYHVFSANPKFPNFVIVASLSVWLFLLLGGLNYLSNGTNNIPFFESLVSSFNSRECHLMFGSPLSDPRCREYILYCAFMSFILTVIQPAMILCSWISWSNMNLF